MTRFRGKKMVKIAVISSSISEAKLLSSFYPLFRTERSVHIIGS